MPKKKSKNGRKKLYYLDEETVEEIKRNAGIQGLSDSSYLDFLIQSQKLQDDPMLLIKKIRKEKEEVQQRIIELEKQESIAIESASKIHEWQEERRKKRPEAIKIITSKLIAGKIEEAEQIAKTWSRMTSCPAIDLIFEAQKRIRGGI